MKNLFLFIVLLFVCSISYADYKAAIDGLDYYETVSSGGVGIGTVSPGVVGAIPKYTASTTIDDSAVIFEGGGNIGIATTGPTQKLQVVGTVRATAFVGDGSGLTNISGGSVGIGTANTITFWPTTTTIGSLPTETYPTLTELSYVKGATSNIQTQIDGLSVGSGGWTDGGTNISPTTSSDTVGIGTTVSTWAGSRFNVRKTTAPTDTTTFGTYIVGSAADVSYVYPNLTNDVVWSLRGYAKQTGSAANTGGGHSIGVAGLAEDTSVGKLNLAGVEGRTQATGTADRYTGVLGLVEAVNGSYTGKLYGMQSTFVGTHNGDSISFYAVPTSSGTRNYSFWGSNDLVITSGNVGVGTYRPSANLELVKQSTTTPLMISSTASSDGDYLIVKSSGNVGINTINPVSALNVVGTVNATAFVGDGSGLTNISGGSVGIGTANTITFWPTTTTIGSLPTSTYPSLTELSYVKGTTSNIQTQIDGLSVGSGGWNDGGTNVYTSTTTDIVGIGTTTPSTTLEIVKQGSSAPLMVSSTATGDGNIMIITSAGNVGIGTLLPRGSLDLGPTGTIYTQTIAGPTGPTILGTAGNVGIGTYTAGALLTVGSTGQAAITSAGVATLPTPNLTGKIDINNVAVDDDDCTGEQGKFWYDSTDSAFEFCRDNSGTPERLGHPSPPASQTITAGATITADACGTFKDISSAGAVTTNTTNTFTAPSSDLSGCCMNVVNTGANNITLDNNSLFYSAGGADVVLGLADSAIVCTNGTVWAQMGGSNN